VLFEVFGHETFDATPKAARNDPQLTERELVLGEFPPVHGPATVQVACDDGFGALLFLMLLAVLGLKD